MIGRLWPQSLKGQMLLAVAVALMLVQAFGAFLIYGAQMERREVAVTHAAAFRLLSPVSPSYAPRLRLAARFPEVPRSFRVERTADSPIRPGEKRETKIEETLRRVLIDQDFPVDRIAVVERSADSDARIRQRLDHESRVTGRESSHLSGRLLVIAVHRRDEKDWYVVRVLDQANEAFIIKPLLMQTLVIYVVMVGAIALVLRRITRPLAALTNRVERFTDTRDPDGRIAPEGPDDIRRLIVAQNKMEARISALLDEKDVMLGAIGHDLKTPLAALRVRIESVEDDAERRKMATAIEDIVHTLDDILSLARVGRPSDPREPSELSALVAAVVEEYEDMGEDVSLEPMQRQVVPLRVTWLRRALRNLIGNALRYGSSATVSLARENGRAVIRIDDDGPGIPEADIASMLDPFIRGEPSRNTETGGAGLGLALARAIAEQHGGDLRLGNRRRADGSVAGLRAELALPLA